MFNADVIDQTKNRVYINPNFNKSSSNNITNTGMHVNPKFTHFFSNVQPNLQNKPKIYVNPNFMKSRSTVDNVQPSLATSGVHQTSYINNYISFPNAQFKREQEILTVPEPISKTRYCLVRQNVNKISEKIVVDKPSTTYQLNKYKSVPLKDIKLNLDSAKNNVVVKPFALTTIKKYTNSSSNVSRNQFKINYKIKVTPINTNKKMLLTKLKLKKVRGNLKKNNIPCRMFKKFGKCIRNKCEFLHDKNHVSICRKFLKGLCHDQNCLLSHDLTTKKLPTCYFYLQGNCTKTNCPYLHVKLSEKVKVCSDFLKGYCEKGNECLQRHVEIPTIKASNTTTRPSLIPKRKHNKVKDKKPRQMCAKMTQNAENTRNVNEKQTTNTDCRYYQEKKGDVNNSETCEIIKPLRCKLGTLPSFIQL